MRKVTIMCAALFLPGFCSGTEAALKVTAIAGGSLALASDGTVWSWDPLPVRVSGLSGVVAIAGGYTHGLAAQGDGTVWEWGSSLTPVQVKDLNGVVAVAAGAINSLALKSDGTVWCWGSRCQPGKPSDFLQSTPVPVNELTGVIAIAAGQAHCLALKSDGTVWAWGHNGYGQLGDGTIGPVGWSDTTALVQASGLTGVTAIAAGYAHSLALKSDGTVWTWGIDGTIAAYRLTSEQVGDVGAVVSIAAGMYRSVAVKRDGTVSEWGLGQATPIPVSGLSAVQTVSPNLALTNDGAVWGWGGYAPAIRLPRVVPEQVNGVTGVKAVATGGPGVLAVTDQGSVWEWSERSRPIEVGGLRDVVSIAMGSHYNIALKSDGTVWEWRGESPPLQVSDLAGVVAIAAAEDIRLAVKGDGTVWQWSSESTPTQVSGLSGVVAVSVGLRWDFFDGPYPSFCLALKSDGTVWRWAKGVVPAQVRGLNGVAAIFAGETGIALKSDGTVWEWNWEGSNLPTMPVPVSGLTGVVAVAAGSTSAFSGWESPTAYGLALKEDGTVWAWGDNRFGQLGDGTTTNRKSAVQVGGLRDVAAITAAAVSSEFGTLPVSLAVRRDGTVWGWGFQEFGWLDKSKPVQLISPGSPDLVMAMGHAGEFTAGDQGIYILTVRNAGWSMTDGTVTVNDTLPPGLTYLSGIGESWTCAAADHADHIVTCTNPDPIKPGASSTIILTVRVEGQAWPGVTNLATVTNVSDPVTANNSAGDPTVVLRRSP